MAELPHLEIVLAIPRGDSRTTTAVFLIRTGQVTVCRGRVINGTVHGIRNRLTNQSWIGSEMKPPIIVTEPGDVDVFESVRDAERYLEAPSVKKGRLKVYDSEGHLLSLEQESVPDVKLFGVALIIDPGTVKIGREESATTHKDELRGILVEFLMATGVDQESLEDATLENVLTQVITRQGFTK